MKTIGLVIVLICTVGIYWKKNLKLIRARRCQYNVMTLNQTVLLVLLLNVDSVVLSYFLQGRPVLSRSEISRFPKLTVKDRSIKTELASATSEYFTSSRTKRLTSLLSGKGRLVFTLEMLRTILIENIFFKSLVPVYLILQSRTHLKSLWADRQPERLRFFMSTQKIIGRPVISKYQTTEQEDGAIFNYRNNVRQRRNRNHVTITIHAEEKFGELALVV